MPSNKKTDRYALVYLQRGIYSSGSEELQPHNLHMSYMLVPQLPNSLRPHEQQPARLLCPWDSPGKNTGVGCHAFLQGIFQTMDQTRVSCIAGRFFTVYFSSVHKPLWDSFFFSQYFYEICFYDHKGTMIFTLNLLWDLPAPVMITAY